MPGAKKRSGVTQRDIARLAQVSQATVSRVIGGDPRVDQETILRVQKVIREANYRPDVAARNLRSRTTSLIGLVIKRPHGGLQDDPFFANLIAGIMDYLSGTNYHLCVELTTDRSQDLVYEEMLRSKRVDGLILVESQASDDRIARLQEDKFPFVLIGNPMGAKGSAEPVMSVDNDNVIAAREATEHLLDAGFKKVGFLAGPKGVTVSEDRIAGYQAAIADKEVPCRIWHSEFGLAAAKRTAQEILTGNNIPDALVVLDDFMATGVVLAARHSHLRIPEDLGIVSFNDSSFCLGLEGGMTSVSLNIDEIVRAACDQLLDVISGTKESEPRRVIVPTKLMVRGSSRPQSRMVMA